MTTIKTLKTRTVAKKVGKKMIARKTGKTTRSRSVKG